MSAAANAGDDVASAAATGATATNAPAPSAGHDKRTKKRPPRRSKPKPVYSTVTEYENYDNLTPIG